MPLIVMPRERLKYALMLRERLKYALTCHEVNALTYHEVKMIVMQRLIKVDDKVRTDMFYLAGFQDVVEIEKVQENFRLQALPREWRSRRRRRTSACSTTPRAASRSTRSSRRRPPTSSAA
jgi:hypothetical protein